MPYIRPKPARTPRSPVGHTSSRPHLEHEEHVRGPLADAAHERELAHDLVVGQARDAIELDESFVDLLREVDDRSRLGGRQTRAAEDPPSASAARR